MKLGNKIWVFPDGDIPPHDPYDLALKNQDTHGHESLVVLNTGDQAGQLKMTVYYSDKDPVVLDMGEIGAKRVKCYRTDEPVGTEGYRIPEGQYALVLECTTEVVAQIGRMDIRQPNLAYYTVMGYPADTAK